MEANKTVDKGCLRTRLALLWMNLAGEPFVALYTLFPFILRKDLHATALELAIFISLRPAMAVFSFYWNALFNHKAKNLLNNLIFTWILAYVPFLAYPFLDHYWYFLMAAGCYQLFSKAVTPTFMELLKQNVPTKPRTSLYSFSYVLCFIASIVIGLIMGSVLDKDGSYWKLLSFICSVIALSSILVQRRIPHQAQAVEEPSQSKTANPILAPLKESVQLLKTNQELRHFQIGFMIGGSALMLMLPALPLYYADTLVLSHENISHARFIFMAIGVTGSSFLWKRSLEKRSINEMMPWITIGFGLFPLLLLLAYFDQAYLSLAFLMYGIAQGGSHLIWNLSGMILSKEQNSAPFTSMNILFQGIRGIIFPLLGGVLCQYMGAIPVLILGSLICFWGVFVMFKNALQYRLKRATSEIPS